MTEQEKREKAIEEMSVILEKQYLTDCRACLSDEPDCFHCCAKEIYDFILRKEKEVEKETAKKIYTKLINACRFDGHTVNLYQTEIAKFAKEDGVEVEE